MPKSYIFQVERSHGYGYGNECHTPTEMETDHRRYICHFDGQEIKLESYSFPSRVETGTLIYRCDTGYEKYWLKHDYKLPTNLDQDVLAVYYIHAFAGGEVRIYKDNRISYTQYGSGRPLLSTSLGHLRKK